MPKILTLLQKEDLERSVTYDEIKRAVWDCGTNKSPGPDGFTFNFIRRYWKGIDKDVVKDVEEFFVSSKFPPGSNSSFITLIPKTQDAKMVKDFRPISLIGSTYKIITKIMANRLSMVISDLVSDVQSAFVSNRQILDAFDSVRWDFLDDILDKFGFGTKWRGWIQGCLSSAMGSILVNGSPTTEFKFHKGLKQGDPLSPFLFILVMESLHLSFNHILNAGLFKGIFIDNSLTLSHLFYANDAVFLEEVNSAASLIGCTTLSTPFNYLGVKIGAPSSRSSSWEEVLSKISYRLSKWKLKSLSIGGRVTLLKSVLSSMPLYHMSIYKVPMGVLNRMESLAMYGVHGSLDNPGNLSRHSPWSDIIKEARSLSVKGINIMSYVKKKLGNDEHTFFWEDVWLTNRPLKLSFPWLYALECEKDVSVAAKLIDSSLTSSFIRNPRGGSKEEQYLLLMESVAPVILSNSSDRWVWSLDSAGYFSVKSIRTLIDDSFLPSVGNETRWINVVPIKINIFAWKVCLDKLLARFNLSLRGLDILSILCPICHSAGESSSHLFFSCNVARLLQSKVARWWDLVIIDIHSYDDWYLGSPLFVWLKGLKMFWKGSSTLCGG
ncbi:RNA-directed DNA polymerase, eukaryota [Tanacetum coccineum]